MDIGISASNLRTVLESDCGFLDGKISVESLETTYSKSSMGKEYQINFFGVSAEVGQYRMISSNTDPLVGVDMVNEKSVVRAFGTNLVWQVIPADYFYTRHADPQVVVEIDSMPAVCASTECDYVYYDGTSQITAFELSAQQLTITGINFGTPLKVEMGFVDCSNIEASATSITCDLAYDLPGGSWYPVVIESEGKVKLEASVAAEVVTMTITAVDPKTNLNPAGGDTITIDGTNFPSSTDSRYELSITLGAKTRCVPSSITSTQIVCESEPFTTSRRRVLQSTFDITISLTSDVGLISEIDSGLELNTNPITATSISPERISPISLETVVIQLYADYPTALMTKEDLKVTLVPESLELSHLNINNEGIRELNVVAVDTVAKTLTVKYGGAYSGTYDLVIKSTANGNIDTATSNVQLLVVFELTDF